MLWEETALLWLLRYNSPPAKVAQQPHQTPPAPQDVAQHGGLPQQHELGLTWTGRLSANDMTTNTCSHERGTGLLTRRYGQHRHKQG